MSLLTASKSRAKVSPTAAPLPTSRMERVESWGMNQSVMSYVYRPSTVDGIREAFDVAKSHGLAVGMRGAGCSYGDAALVSEGVCLDLSRMTRILEWNPETGVIRVEPGVTIGQIWHYTIGDGWWPAVVSGTMSPTIGGAASMNIHGKNNFRTGTIGDHILDFDILLPSGEIRHCSRETNSDLFHAAIGGFGMLGCFTQITLELKRVHSGLMRVQPLAVRTIGEMIHLLEERMDKADYLVGWVDCFAGGNQLGRGLVHQANYLDAGVDPRPEQTLRIEHQDLPDTLFGILPKSIVWRFMRPFAMYPRLGMRFVNTVKYHMSRLFEHGSYLQAHAAFAFLLDYVPNWKFAYRPGGLIQYQSFIPAENAEKAFRAEITLCQQRGIVPMLGVFKRHRSDPFLMTHSVNGYSLALDFLLTDRNRRKVWQLAAELDRIVLENGGRFYYAKDSTLSPERLKDYLSEERVQKFLALKRECDPIMLLQTELFRRIFASSI